MKNKKCLLVTIVMSLLSVPTGYSQNSPEYTGIEIVPKLEIP